MDMDTSTGATRTTRVLLVEDNPADANFIRQTIGQEGRPPIALSVCGTLAAALKAIATDAPDLVLLDLGLPDAIGTAGVEQICAVQSGLPVIVLTGDDDSEVAAECMRLGAHDYLIKGEGYTVVNRAIHNTVARAQAQRAAAEARENLKRTLADAQDAILVLDCNNTVKFANRAAQQLFGDSVAEGQVFGFPLAQRETPQVDVRRPDGTIATVEMCAGKSTWYDEPAQIVTLRDVTDRIRRQVEIEHLNLVLKAIRNINQLIVREKDRATLIQQACELLVESRGYNDAWIGLVKQDESTPAVAHAGRKEHGALLATMLREGRWPQCQNQAQAAPDGMVVLAPRKHCQSCPLSNAYDDDLAAVLPLRHDGRVHGFLGVSFLRDALLTEEEKALMSEIAGDIAFAVSSIETESKRRQSEELFRASFHASAVGQALTSLDGRFLQVNEALTQLLGYSAEELVSKNHHDVIHPDERGVGTDTLSLMHAGEPVTRFTNRYLAKDGHVGWAIVHVAMVKGPDGKASHFLVAMSDITAEIQSHAVIRDLARFPAENPAPVLRLRSDGIVLYANPASTPLMEEHRFSTGDRAPVALCEVATTALGTGRTSTFELPIGDVIFEFVATPFPDDSYVNFYGNDITHLKRTEVELRTEKEFAESLISTAQAIVLLLDPQGQIVHFNPYMETLSGFRLSEVQGQDWFDTFLPERTRANVRPLFARSLGGEPTRGNVDFIRTRDGRELLIEWYDRPLHNDDGSVTGLLCVGHDVTARQRAEDDLRFQRMLLASQNEASLDGILNVDVNGNIIWFNRRFVELWEIHQGVLDSRSDKAVFDAILTKLVAPDAFAAKVNELYAQRTARSRDEILLKDGRVFDRYSSPVMGEDGRCLGRVWLFRDVTVHKQAETRLRESEKKFATLFNSSPAAMAVMTIKDGRFLDANQAFLDCVEYERDDLIGRTTTEVGVYREAGHPEGILDILATGPMHDVEVKTRTGKPRQMLFHGEQITVDAQACLLAVGVDISERKRAEKERHDLQASLAQSDRLASMGMLAAGVAHEINNPLSYVLYNIESLAQDFPRLTAALKRCHSAFLAELGAESVAAALGDAQYVFEPDGLDDVVERLGDALSGVQRIKQIVRSLGTFSRVERTDVTPVNIQTCIEHAATMGFNEIKYRARFVKDYSQVPAVLASDGKIAQVFLNLLVNAAHAIEEGHVEQNEIRVRTWSTGDWVYAEVSDTGSGIAPENLARVFQPFFTTKAVGIGTGLGLSICKKIIEEFGGTISCTSELGKGTKFLLRLPRVPSGWIAGSQDKPVGTTVPSSIRGRILVIDDEAAVCAAIARILAADHEVLTVTSGLDGQALLKKDKSFDLIFCDLMMPEMSGMELHAWLAGQDRSLAERVIFITGGAFTPGASEYLAKVGNLRVDKPFDTEAFKNLTVELLRAARSKRAPTLN